MPEPHRPIQLGGAQRLGGAGIPILGADATSEPKLPQVVDDTVLLAEGAEVAVGRAVPHEGDGDAVSIIRIGLEGRFNGGGEAGIQVLLRSELAAQLCVALGDALDALHAEQN